LKLSCFGGSVMVVVVAVEGALAEVAGLLGVAVHI
jgi:hypothetical protein